MNEPKPQPWHEADEKPGDEKPLGGAPLGTHSLTGGGANVGMPPKGRDAEHVPDPDSPGKEEPDLMAEPRAGRADILGRKR